MPLYPFFPASLKMMLVKIHNFCSDDFIIIIHFSHQRQLMASHRSLRASQTSEVAKTFPSFPSDFKYTAVWMVSTSLISKISNIFTKLLGIVPRVPIIIGIIVILSSLFYSSLARSKYLSLSFIFTLWSVGTAKSCIWQVLFFCWLSLLLSSSVLLLLSLLLLLLLLKNNVFHSISTFVFVLIFFPKYIFVFTCQNMCVCEIHYAKTIFSK